jgi:membrane protease YdiL (CAAX protease family)
MQAPTNTIAPPPAATGWEDLEPASRPRVPQSAAAAPDARALPQLGLGAIIGVWAAAAVPMGLLAWLVAPALADRLSGPASLSRALIMTLTVGLIWQFVLVMVLVGREQGSLRWPVVRDALWLSAPRSPRSGRRGGRVWLVVVPLMFALAAEELVPSFANPVGRDLGEFLGSDAGHALLGGSWGWFALLATMFVFNTVLGEELLFRGYLLPRMNGVFGRRDWVANGVLFAVYHLHVPWVIPAGLLDTFIVAGPSKRYRSALVGIAVHSAQSVLFVVLVLALVLEG